MLKILIAILSIVMFVFTASQISPKQRMFGKIEGPHHYHRTGTEVGTQYTVENNQHPSIKYLKIENSQEEGKIEY